MKKLFWVVLAVLILNTPVFAAQKFKSDDKVKFQKENGKSDHTVVRYEGNLVVISPGAYFERPTMVVSEDKLESVV